MVERIPLNLAFSLGEKGRKAWMLRFPHKIQRMKKG